jgi:hypothetical protein
MATKFYGKCQGSSGSKYDLWISATQNSQNASNNQSNVTISLYLKRNDGYSASAHNLYELQNTVKLSVGGVERINKNIKIDTRNGATVLLCTWTGDLTHNSDGTLSVSINGSFSINSSNLTGGSASGALVCTTIPRCSTATFSVTAVNPGSAVGLTISAASSDFSHKIKWSLAEKSSTQSLNKGVLTTSFTVPKEWTSSLTNSSKGSISVTVSTYNGTKLVGSKGYSLAFIIPAVDEYKPNFSLKLVRSDNGVPSNWGEYVQNISTVTVEPENLQFKYGAAMAAVTVSIGSAYIRKLPATFNLTETGSLTVTLAIRDTRGLLTFKQTTINVEPYTPPSISVNKLFRCNENGEEDTYGTFLSLKYDYSYSSINGKNEKTATVKFKTTNDATYSSPVEITSNPFVFGDGNIPASESVTVCVGISDSISPGFTEVTRAVPSANIPFNIKKGGRGAAFGKFAEKDDELSLGWNLTVDGDVGVKGILLFEEVPCEATESISEIIKSIRYYPCLNGCLVRLRVKPSMLLAPGQSHHVATIKGKSPGVFTPLNCMVNISAGGQATAGVAYETGNVYIRSDTEIQQNSNVYISGFYFADYS